MTVQSLAASYSLATFIESQAPKCLSGKGSSTTDKLHIALALCRNILNLHASGWVHRNIRSQNIILVPVNHNTASSDQSKDVIQNYTQYLKGFEFSRSETRKSSGRANFDPDKNLYRHLERQNVPDTRSIKIHDLYAVGVVLLEIGL